jgi:hypothetical protein
MNERFQRDAAKKPWLRPRQRELQEEYHAQNDDVPDLMRVRAIQNIRFISAEAEYIGSKARFQILQLEFQQLRLHIMGKLDEIRISREHGRQRLQDGSQSTSNIIRWQYAERRLNQDVDEHHTCLLNSHEAMQTSESAMRQAAEHRQHANRRLSKFDEILKIMNEAE